jgi:hypothetical protein
MKLADLFRSTAVAPGRLRQQIFALGDRHKGDALSGARRELDDPDLTPERRSLLRAVVAHLGSGGVGGAGATAEHIRRPATLTDAVYVGVIAASAAWTIITLRSLLP